MNFLKCYLWELDRATLKMGKAKKCILFLLMLILNVTSLFADFSGRGRISDFKDKESALSDFGLAITAIILTVLGAFLTYGYITTEKDKITNDMGRWGCALLIVGIGCLILLIRSCAN